MKGIDYFLAAIIAGALVLAVRRMIISSRQHKGCGGCCEGCQMCSSGCGQGEPLKKR